MKQEPMLDGSRIALLTSRRRSCNTALHKVHPLESQLQWKMCVKEAEANH